MTREQMKRIVPGSVIVSPTGRKRTVISVHRVKTRTIVSVPILHCSWTKRPLRILWTNELAEYRLTKVVLSIRRWKIGRELVREDAETPCGDRRTFFCCDVIGKFQ